MQAPLLPELFFRKIDFSLIDKVHSTMAPERRPAGDVIESYKYTFGKTPGKATTGRLDKMKRNKAAFSKQYPVYRVTPALSDLVWVDLKLGNSLM